MSSNKLFFLFILGLFSSYFSFAQSRHITGRVTNSQNYAVSGVSVGISGASLSTLTNVDGIYFITARADSILLTFYYPGYVYEVISVPPGQTVVNVVLQDEPFLISRRRLYEAKISDYEYSPFNAFQK
ncbi:MAG: carboxypeptidase-like regulatory domain-containing protein [Pseudobacter sp.]|uniref:carboxypeptidase-like regulatory domain-containing protein n=1 Tax=Pseudobacter sp. TaxID=2045420 RepID=UPI003F7FA767